MSLCDYFPAVEPIFNHDRPYYDKLNRLPIGMYNTASYVYYIFTCCEMKFILRSSLPYTNKLTIYDDVGIIQIDNRSIFMRDVTAMQTSTHFIYRMFYIQEYIAQSHLSYIEKKINFTDGASIYNILPYPGDTKHTARMRLKWKLFTTGNKDPIYYPDKPTGAYTKAAIRTATEDE